MQHAMWKGSYGSSHESHHCEKLWITLSTILKREGEFIEKVLPKTTKWRLLQLSHIMSLASTCYTPFFPFYWQTKCHIIHYTCGLPRFYSSHFTENLYYYIYHFMFALQLSVRNIQFPSMFTDDGRQNNSDRRSSAYWIVSLHKN